MERVVSESEVWCRSNPRQHGDIIFFLPLKRNGQPVKIISEIDYRETRGYFKAWTISVTGIHRILSHSPILPYSRKTIYSLLSSLSYHMPPNQHIQNNHLQLVAAICYHTTACWYVVLNLLQYQAPLPLTYTGVSYSNRPEFGFRSRLWVRSEYTIRHLIATVNRRLQVPDSIAQSRERSWVTRFRLAWRFNPWC